MTKCLLIRGHTFGLLAVKKKHWYWTKNNWTKKVKIALLIFILTVLKFIIANQKNSVMSNQSKLVKNDQKKDSLRCILRQLLLVNLTSQILQCTLSAWYLGVWICSKCLIYGIYKRKIALCTDVLKRLRVQPNFVASQNLVAL